MGAVKFLTETGLFVGQSDAFFATLAKLAAAADAARVGDQDDEDGRGRKGQD